jgi:hypothetical protein
MRDSCGAPEVSTARLAQLPQSACSSHLLTHVQVEQHTFPGTSLAAL